MTASDHLALALDVDDLVVAQRLGRELRPHFRVAKVGLELFSAAGSDAVIAMLDLGYDVLLDVKLHDIPTTVGKAARVLGALGVTYLTVHASGGADMLRAAVEGLTDGADKAGLAVPMVLAVTVLTSDAEASPEVLRHRVGVAVAAGAGGVVCAATDLAVVTAAGPDLFTLVPGIRMPGTPADDQGRTALPVDALAAGADLLVIGRTVTAAPDHLAAAEQLVASMAGGAAETG